MQTGTASIRLRAAPHSAGGLCCWPKRGRRAIGALFDEIDPDGKCGQDNWEQAESELQKRAVKK